MVFPLVVFAETNPAPLPGAAAVTWPAVVAAVERGNPELAALGLQPDIEAGNLRQAAAIPNPEVEGEVSESGGRGDRRSFAVAETTVTLSQTLELGGKRAARSMAARQAFAAAKATVAARRQELLGEARRLFVDLLLKQQRAALEREAGEIAAASLASAEQRLQLKAATAVDVSRAKAAVATARADLTRAESELAATRIRLAALWGDAEPRFAQAEGALEEPVALPTLEALLAHLPSTPRLLRARLAVARAGAEQALEQTKRRPDVTVYGGVTRYSETSDHSFVVGVSVPLPLFDRNQGAIAAAAARRRQAEAEARAAEAAARSALTAAYQEYVGAVATATRLSQDALPAAKAAHEAVREGHEKGKYGWLGIIAARETWLAARRQHLEHLGAARQALAEIEGIVGSLPPTPTP